MSDQAEALSRRELRIAPVMTGGTSLAVWMGGVTSELYSLVERSGAKPGSVSEIYERLLNLTGTTPVVDVITGTSAGGLNGSLLAAAVCLQVPRAEFAQLHKTWMKTADLEQLIRKPSEQDPPSLLKGDDFFLARIRELLAGWAKGRMGAGAPRTPIDLVTTYTVVHPLPLHHDDDFGEDLNEVVYAGTLQFNETHFGSPDIVDKLALASRTSASIPGVFEPSFLPSRAPANTAAPLATNVTAKVDASGSTPLNLAPHQPLTARGVDRWAVDGGLVVNLPLTEALDRIFDRSATAIVRRVILYVCPTPPALAAAAADDPKVRPGIRESALTAVSAPRAEGIAGDLEVIRRHNRIVARQRDVRRHLDSFIGAFEGSLAATPSSAGPRSMFDIYKDRRTEASLDMVIDRLRAGGHQLPMAEDDFRGQLRKFRSDLLPSKVTDFAGIDRPVWAWGIASVEEGASTALGLINRSLELNAVVRGLDVADRSGTASRAATLSDAKRRIHAAAATLREIRSIDEAYWMKTVGLLARPTGSALVNPYPLWPYANNDGLNGDEQKRRRLQIFLRLKQAHRKIACALLGARSAMIGIGLGAGAVLPPATDADMRAVAGTAPRAPRMSSRETSQRAAKATGVLTELLSLAPVPAAGANATTAGAGPRASLRREIEALQQRLLLTHVVSTLLFDDVTTREQPTELMQVSWNAPNYLDPDRSPDDKLVGPELARLGAFLKPSWRANDWIWGRMDGAARLARLLIDPRRLYELGITAAELINGLQLTGVDDELAFLADGSDSQVPDDLPLTVQQVITALQVAIAREELPGVAQAVEDSRAIGGNEADHGKFRAMVDTAYKGGTVPDIATACELVKAMTIGTETAASEVGSGLMLRIMTRAAGVAVNTLTGAGSGLGAAARVLRPLRAPLHGLNAVIGLLTGSSRLARGATAMILAIAGAVLAVRVSGAKIGGPLVALAFVLFLGPIVVALLRSGPKRVIPALLACGLVVGLALIGDDLGSILYSGTASLTETTLAKGTVISFDADTVVRIERTDNGDKLVEDLRLGTTATATVSKGSATAASTPVARVAAWKQAGFIEISGGSWWIARVTVFGCIVGLVALAAIVGLVCRKSLKMPKRLLAIALWLTAGGGALTVVPRFAKGLLTGTEPTTDVYKADGVKGAMVWAAHELHAWQLPVLLVVLVGISSAIALGVDRFRRSS